MDVPWLPPWPYNSTRDDERRHRQAGLRAELARYFPDGKTVPDPPLPSAREIRWKAEDGWLTDQYGLTLE